MYESLQLSESVLENDQGLKEMDKQGYREKKVILTKTYHSLEGAKMPKYKIRVYCCLFRPPKPILKSYFDNFLKARCITLLIKALHVTGTSLF